jgi:hypothetical protein
MWKQQQLVVGISKLFCMYRYTYIKVWTVTDEQSQILSENRYISVLQNIQTGRATPPPPPPNQQVTEYLSPEVKQPEREVDHSASSSVAVNNGWSCNSTPLICLQGA